MAKINIQDLSSALVEHMKLNVRDASLFVSAMFDIVQANLEQDKLVKIKGLGTFKIIDVDDRESVNVNTGERVLIEGHGKITFTPDPLMKELVNKPFSQFETVVLNDGVDFADVPASGNQVLEPVGEVVEESIEQPVEEDSTFVPLVDFVDEPVFIPEIGIEPVPEPEPEPELEPEPEPEPGPELEPEPEPVPEPEPEPEPQPEIEDEDIPEWVIEPIAPVSQEETPVVEEAPAMEEDVPAVEEDVPAVEEDVPAVEEDVPAVEEDVPAVEEEVPAVEEEVSAEESMEEPSVEEPSVEEPEIGETGEHGNKNWLAILLSCLLGLGIGYLLGNYFPFSSNNQNLDVPPVVKPEAPKPVAKPDTTQSVAVADSVKQQTEPAAKAEVQPEAKPEAQADAKPEVKPEVKTVIKPEVKSEAKPETKPAADPSNGIHKQYAAKDARVRLGGWIIVGTDKVVKVKEGETLTKISRRHFGPDMECYIEVYNNLTKSSQLKVGQEIKIPKLVIKKKKKTVQNTN